MTTAQQAHVREVTWDDPMGAALRDAMTAEVSPGTPTASGRFPARPAWPCGGLIVLRRRSPGRGPRGS